MRTLFCYIWPIDRTLSGAITSSLSGPGSDGCKRVFCIPQSSSITGATPSHCLVLYSGQLLREPYPSAEMRSVYSVAPNRVGSQNLFNQRQKTHSSIFTFTIFKEYLLFFFPCRLSCSIRFFFFYHTQFLLYPFYRTEKETKHWRIKI